jgi:hypothetical protein
MKQIGCLEPYDYDTNTVFWSNIQVAERLGHAVIIKAERDEHGHIRALAAWASHGINLPTGRGS